MIRPRPVPRNIGQPGRMFGFELVEIYALVFLLIVLRLLGLELLAFGFTLMAALVLKLAKWGKPTGYWQHRLMAARMPTVWHAGGADSRPRSYLDAGANRESEPS